MTAPDLDALEKRLRGAADDFADHATPIEGDGQTETLLREASDMIAELREARGLLDEARLYFAPDEDAVAMLVRVDAFLARNGKGEG